MEILTQLLPQITSKGCDPLENTHVMCGAEDPKRALRTFTLEFTHASRTSIF